MKIRIYVLILLMSFFIATPAVNAAEKMTLQQKEQRALQINARVIEIKKMDLSQLSTEQRKELRTELKGYKTEIKQMGPVRIVISLGLLVVIIILILILL